MSALPAIKTPMFGNRPDIALQNALAKVAPEQQEKARKASQDFEAVFLNSMFAQMTTGLKSEGPFGDTPGTSAWRSMLTDEYARNFSKSGGVGISTDVFRTLIMRQAQSS